MAKSYWAIPNLKRAERIILLHKDRASYIYTMCIYCGVKSGHLTFWETVKQGQAATTSKDFLSKPFRNFQGHLMKVAYIDYFPFMYCTKKELVGRKKVCVDAIGSEYELLKTLSKTLNFTYELTTVPNRSYPLLYDRLTRGEYNFAVGGLTVTTERFNIVDFSSVIRIEEVAVMIAHKETWEVHYQGLLSINLLYALLTTATVLALLIFLILKYSTKSFKTSYVEILMIVLMAFCEQPTSVKKIVKKQVQSPIYALLSSWWLFTMMINIIAKSKLSAFMIAKPIPHVNLTQLLGQGYQLVSHHPLTASYLNIFTDEERLLLNSTTSFRKLNICEVLCYIDGHKAIIAGEISRNLLHPRLYCADRNQTIKLSSHIRTEVFRVTPYAWAFKAGTPFVDIFSEHIKKVADGGFFRVWVQNILYQKKFSTYSQKIPDDREATTKFASFVPAFIMYSTAVCGCCACFLVEIAYSRWQIRRK